MGTVDSGDLGSGFPPSRGGEDAPREEISLAATAAKDFAEGAKTFGNSRSGEHGKNAQIEMQGVLKLWVDRVMAYTDFFSLYNRRRFFERYPSAALWLVAAGQAVAMLGISVLLRSLMS